VEGKPIDQVREMWTAYARGGVAAMHAVVGDAPVEWIPLGRTEPVPPSEFWASGAGERASRCRSPCTPSRNTGRACSRTGACAGFREGGFSDGQPSWVYFFHDGVFVRGASFPTREAALEAISRFRAEA
jgi:hypothetical protein